MFVCRFRTQSNNSLCLNNNSNRKCTKLGMNVRNIKLIFACSSTHDTKNRITKKHLMYESWLVMNFFSAIYNCLFDARANCFPQPKISTFIADAVYAYITAYNYTAIKLADGECEKCAILAYVMVVFFCVFRFVDM